MSESRRATVYIVATPIGTLADCSNRARDILAHVDFILCEDTRRTRELLQALSIAPVPLVSLHEHNEAAKCQLMIDRLQSSSGQRAALVSDAGTPAISDPGAAFINACHLNGVKIENIPGPSSLVAALAASGFIQPRTIFSGFLARTCKEQREEFKRWSSVAPCIAVCFESPNRVAATLKNAAEFFPQDTLVCLSREISKKFEEHIRKEIVLLAQDLDAGLSIRGECILTFNLTSTAAVATDGASKSMDDILKEALTLLEKEPHRHLKEVSRDLALKYSIGQKDLYNAILASRR